jgi:hypothetical protein
MQPLSTRPAAWIKPALAGAMAGVVLLLALVASSESLHHHFHGSATDGQSPCAICSVVRGHMDAPTSVSPEAAVALVFAWTLPRIESALPHAVDCSVASDRGPPPFFSSL